MTLQDLKVIWVDGTFEGNNYESMKNEFNTAIGTSSSLSSSSNPIDNLICKETKEDLVTNGVPVICVRTSDEAKEQIKNHPTAKLFFISSGSIGENLVPEIVNQYPHIHSFYIYCFKMANHCEWALDYVNCLQMFDHQIDLLVRLMRDISVYFIEQGKIYLQFNDPKNALKYFKHARNLENRANQKDKMEPQEQADFRVRLNLLEGENGLIRQAENA